MQLVVVLVLHFVSFFFFNDTATTEIYTLSLHDALPIFEGDGPMAGPAGRRTGQGPAGAGRRSEEHTSELQSRQYLVCRLLLEKKKKNKKNVQIEDTTHYQHCNATHTTTTPTRHNSMDTI